MSKATTETFQEVGRVRPDGKGRVTLGKFAQGVSSFAVHKDSEGRLLLEPYAEVPARERWLFANQEAAKRVARGIEDASAGRIRALGSFRRYIRAKEND